MSGTGQKRQLKKQLQNLHEMLRFLGQDDGSQLIIKIDQFQQLRRDFIKAAQQYEKSSNNLQNLADSKQRKLQIIQISSKRDDMDRILKQMMNMCMKMKEKNKNKINNKQKDKGKDKGKDTDKIQQQLQYKSLTVYQLQNIYFKLTKKQPKQIQKRTNQNYPQQQTLQQLKLKKPLKRGFSEQSDHQSEEYIKQQQLLDAIKYIDNRIQQKMDYILDGLRMLNYNAVTISQSIGVVHNKILINVDKLDENLDKMAQAQKLLDQAAPLVSKPNCIMNVIIAILLAILVYFIIKKLYLDDPNNNTNV